MEVSNVAALRRAEYEVLFLSDVSVLFFNFSSLCLCFVLLSVCFRVSVCLSVAFIPFKKNSSTLITFIIKWCSLRRRRAPRRREA